MREAKTKSGIFVQITIHLLFKCAFTCLFTHRLSRSGNRHSNQ